MTFENYIFTILSVKERRIEKVKITIVQESSEEEKEENE